MSATVAVPVVLTVLTGLVMFALVCCIIWAVGPEL